MYRGNLRTGEGAILVPGATGRAAIGVEYARGLLFVAGWPAGGGPSSTTRARARSCGRCSSPSPERSPIRTSTSTTIDRFGKSLYAVNARFGTPSPTRASYSVVRTGR